MSVRYCDKKIVIKGDLEPCPTTFKYNETMVNVCLPLWQLNILEAIEENLENDKGCQIWCSYMKD